MKTLLIFIITLLCVELAAYGEVLPITSFDYGTPENSVSPIAIGMGCMNVTNASDFYASFSNPALLGGNEYSLASASFRVKGDEAMTIADAVQFSNVLRPSQFKYVTLVAKQTALTYQPVASVNIVESPDPAWPNNPSGYRYLDYQLDKWQISLAGSDNSWRPIRFGLNAKYLSGRLVYMRSARPDTTFIDTKVKGFSTDLGLTLQTGSFTIGLVSTDLLSRLWWDWGYESVPLQSRMAFGAQYGTEYLTVSGGVLSRLSRNPDTTYHLGFQYLWDWQGTSSEPNNSQAFTARIGLYSRDFNGTDNINYTLGAGYNYKIFRFDFALNNKGFKLSDSEYLFSLGVGLP
ncbi:MAG TPA: hypothetical protein PL102_02815 [Candidatus Syntrophosphaera sp.]|nr:hypothetical protein [Candidatus Syntrophosphaera sp.]